MSTEIAVTERTKIRRLPQRGVYERETVYEILDEGFVCHVGFVMDGQPFIIPTGYGRKGDTLYVHGAKASRMLKALRDGSDVCVTVTLIDGLVLARSAFHHSMNYRSVIIFGKARLVEAEEEKMEALRSFTEHVVPGRWQAARTPNRQELDATLVLALPLAEASAKVRSGPPIDDEEDVALPVWAGVIPLSYVAMEAVDSPDLIKGIELPEQLRQFNIGSRHV